MISYLDICHINSSDSITLLLKRGNCPTSPLLPRRFSSPPNMILVRDHSPLNTLHEVDGSIRRATAGLEATFVIMCDASDYAVGAVLRKRKDKKLNVIYYVSRTLDEAQCNYAITEKEILAIVFAFEKF